MRLWVLANLELKQTGGFGPQLLNQLEGKIMCDTRLELTVREGVKIQYRCGDHGPSGARIECDECFEYYRDKPRLKSWSGDSWQDW